MTDKYKSLFNDTSTTNDTAVFNDITILNTMTITGAQIDTLPTDNQTIEYATYQLKLKDDGISAAKLQSNSVSTTKIQDSAITTAKIQDSAITNAKIYDVNGSKIYGNLTVSSVDCAAFTSSTGMSFTTTLGTDIFYNPSGSVYYDSGKLRIGDIYTNSSVFNVATLSANRTYTFPNKDGTVAMLSDVSTYNQSLNTSDSPTFATLYTPYVVSPSSDLYLVGTGNIYMTPSGGYVSIPTSQLKITNGSYATILASNAATSNKTITFPNSTGTVALTSDLSGYITASSTDTLTNKSFSDSTTYFVDNVDPNKKVQFQVSTISTGTTRTLSMPNEDTTLVGDTATQTLTNKTLTAPVISTIVNGGSTLTLPSGITDTLIGKQTTDIVRNKSFVDTVSRFVNNSDNTKRLLFDVSNITTGTDRTVVWPNSSFTVVGEDNSATLTYKTLTSDTNVFNGHLKDIKISKNDTDLSVPTSLTELTTPKYTSYAVGANEVVEITACITVNNAPSDATSFRFYHFEIFRDGSSLKAHSQELLQSATGTEYSTLNVQFLDVPGAGTYTYSFKHYASASNMRVQGSRADIMVKKYYCNSITNTTQTWA